MTLVGYVEFYVDDIIEQLIQVAEAGSGKAAQYALAEHRKKATSTWPNRTETLNRMFGFDLAHWQSWSRFDSATWVRNSIAHGRGGLSRKQKATEAPKAELLGARVIDGHLTVSITSLEQCLSACIDFVREVDSAYVMTLENIGGNTFCGGLTVGTEPKNLVVNLSLDG